MDRALISALGGLTSLSSAQLRGVIGVVADLQPALLVQIAERGDLDDELRRHLVRRAPAHLVADLLQVWPPDPALLDVAVDSHGVLPSLVVLCGRLGRVQQAVDLAERLELSDISDVARHWRTQLGEDLPGPVRTGLLHATFVRRGPRPDLASMTDWQQARAMEQLAQEQEKRERIAWRLLEPVPQQWNSLAETGKHAPQVREVLLKYPTALSDEVLQACLPAITADGLRHDEYLAGARIQWAAGHLRRWPRLRQIALEALTRVVQEAVEDGWTPSGRYSGPDWDGIVAVAEISSDTTLLSNAAVTLAQAAPSDYDKADRERLNTWLDKRMDAVVALARNEHLPHEHLLEAVPALDERALSALLRCGNSAVIPPCEHRLAHLRQQEKDRQPTIIEVPPDHELTALEDPVATLREHVRHLRSHAAQRDVTATGLLESKFCTPQILRAVPAYRVLDSSTPAEQVAQMIAEACGDHPDRWATFASQCETQPARKITFGAWLDRLAEATPR